MAVVEAINNPNIDDTYTKCVFFVELPVIHITPIGDKYTGDSFTIAASTNLAVDSEILIEVYSSSYDANQKSQPREFSGAAGVIKVTKGEAGLNQLSFNIDVSTFLSDEYIVKASAVNSDVTASAIFNINKLSIFSFLKFFYHRFFREK